VILFIRGISETITDTKVALFGGRRRNIVAETFYETQKSWLNVRRLNETSKDAARELINLRQAARL